MPPPTHASWTHIHIFCMLWGLCATSKHIYCHGLFCPPLLLALSKWLHAPGYLKTSNASKALTISRDCCYVISGKKVILLHPPPHPPTHRVLHLTHTNTQSLACVPQTHRFTEQYTDKEKNCYLCTVVLQLIGQESGHGDKTHPHT